MKQLPKYLKPYILSLILIVLFVIGQVEAELALPTYMAQMITDGIQYGGIQEESPILISEQTYQTMGLFLAPDTLSKSYTKQPTNTTLTLNNQTFQTTTPTYQLIKDTEDINKAFLYTTFTKSETLQKTYHFNPTDLQTYTPNQIQELKQHFDIELKTFTDQNISSALKMGMKEEFQQAGMHMEEIQSKFIKQTGLKMLGYTFSAAICAMLIAYLAAKVSANVAANLRKDVFHKVEHFELAEFTKFSSASLITRTTNDVQQVQQVLSTLLRLGLFAPFLGIAAIIKVVHYKSMAYIVGLAIAIIASLIAYTFHYNLTRYKKIQKLVDNLNLVSREQLSGLLVVRAFNNQSYEEDRFDRVNKEITDTNIQVNCMIAYIQPFVMFLMSFVGILIVLVSSKQIDAGLLQVGEMMAFIQYASSAIFGFLMIAMVLTMIPRSSISCKRIFEVIDTPQLIHEPTNPKQPPTTIDTITFDHVTFSYPHAQDAVLKDISFQAKKGQTIAIIGSTGCGKSTLINLIPRFFDVTSGSICFNDTNIKDLSFKDLRSLIGYIPQKGVLFSDTIANNLRYANQNATDEDIQTALSVAQATTFVNEKEEGLDYEISQDGTNVSGGQRQRLSIARALTRDAKIYIFDDTFSALDFKTAASLKKEMRNLQKEKDATVFIVAQRISTIQHADLILVLEKGELVGKGRHEDLLETCSIYQEIAYSQLSRKELNHG